MDFVVNFLVKRFDKELRKNLGGLNVALLEKHDSIIAINSIESEQLEF